MTLLALSREQFGQLMHAFIPVSVRVMAILVVLVYGLVAFQRWAFFARPEQKTPRLFWVGAAALVVLGVLVWVWL